MPIASIQDVHDRWDSAELKKELQRRVGRGLKAACIFLAGRIKELVSVPAPRRRVIGKRGKLKGVIYYRATVAATPGAPPRKLSGRFRASITYEVSADGLVGRVGSNAKQARRLEFEGHPYLAVAMQRWRGELARVMANPSV